MSQGNAGTMWDSIERISIIKACDVIYAEGKLFLELIEKARLGEITPEEFEPRRAHFAIAVKDTREYLERIARDLTPILG